MRIILNETTRKVLCVHGGANVTFAKAYKKRMQPTGFVTALGASRDQVRERFGADDFEGLNELDTVYDMSLVDITSSVAAGRVQRLQTL